MPRFAGATARLIWKATLQPWNLQLTLKKHIFIPDSASVMFHKELRKITVDIALATVLLLKQILYACTEQN
jgi:hypothetical protein